MLDKVIDARKADLGHGLVVQRVLPYAQQHMVGPFIFLDHAGPVSLQGPDARRADVRPHPHIGLSTVSYLLSGAVTHRDSLGAHQVIRPGEVNWMTAGRGITHSERFDDPAAFAGSGLELLQSWVALPEADEECEPAFNNYPLESLPTAHDGGLWFRLIAGDAYGLRSTVKTHSPLFYLHTVLQPHAEVTIPAGYAERAAYVAHGRIEFQGRDYLPGQLLVFTPGSAPVLRAQLHSRVMLFGGEPLGERFIFWNFVSSRRERIEQAKADWRAGRFKLPLDDDQEFIPLPK